VLATTQDANTMAVKISMVQAAPEQLHRIKARPATVTGAISAAATAAAGGASQGTVSKTRLCKLRLDRGNGFVRICECGEWNG
jgi:hypothetical protein